MLCLILWHLAIVHTPFVLKPEWPEKCPTGLEAQVSDSLLFIIQMTFATQIHSQPAISVTVGPESDLISNQINLALHQDFLDFSDFIRISCQKNKSPTNLFAFSANHSLTTTGCMKWNAETLKTSQIYLTYNLLPLMIHGYSRTVVTYIVHTTLSEKREF